jgi:hypothetical protein
MDYMIRIDRIFEKILPQTPMKKEDAGVLMNLLMANDPDMNIDINDLDKNSEIYKHFEPVINSFLAQVFLKRIEYFTTLKMSLGALVLMLLYIESPGDSTIYTYYLHGKLAPNTLMTLDVFAMQAFPWGVFSPEQLREIWDAQKRKEDDDVTKCVGAHDNLLDYLETWKTT